ncbi:MAG: ester cyclase [Pseudonocardiaceae bacterium]
MRTDELTETRRCYGDDVCVVEHECRAIMTGHFAGITGNGRRIRFRMLHVFEFRAGCISRENVWLDTATIMAQWRCQSRRVPALANVNWNKNGTAWALYLEDCSDGVVDLLKFFGCCAADALDEAPTGWAIDLHRERPAELPNPHSQQRTRIGVHDVHRIDGRQRVVLVHCIGGDDESRG